MTVVPVPPRTRLASLTSLRAVAALLVFGFHVNLAPLAPLTAQGRLGVSFFFVLSGMLLGLSWTPGTAARTFWRRRAARLYPAYLVAMLAGLVVSHVLGTELGRPGAGLLALLLVQSWVPDAGVYYVWNPVAWSLSTETFFYLLFPLLAPLVLRLGARATRWLRVGCVGVVVALGAWASVALPDTFAQPNSVTAWAVYVAPISRLPEFVLGLTLVAAVRGRRVPVPRWVAGVVVLAAYLVAGLDPTGFGIAAVTVVPIALLLVVSAQADAAGERSVLHRRALVLAGEASYCFYLVHHLVIRLVGHLLPAGAPPGTGPVLCLVVSAGLAWLLHTRVEVPLDRRLGGRRTTA